MHSSQDSTGTVSASAPSSNLPATTTSASPSSETDFDSPEEAKTVQFANAEVKAVGDTDGPGEWEAVISIPTLDRDGEVVAKGAFNPLPTSIPIHVDHRMDSEGLVGTGRPFYEGERLMLRGTFAGTPRAQIIRQLVRERHLGAMSVGFMGATRKTKDGTTTIVKAELLEASFVTVPSNRDALVVAAKEAAVLCSNCAAAVEKSTDTDPATQAAAPAAAESPAPLVDPKALASMAEAEALLTT